MTTQSSFPSTLTRALLCAGAFALVIGLVVAANVAQAAPPDQLATRTPRSSNNLPATATALKGTANAAIATANALATRLSATATAIKLTRTPGTPLPAEEAVQAITEYASRVLSITVNIKKAGGWAGTIVRDVNTAQAQTPKGTSAQSAIVKLAGKTYGAVLSNGAASLSYGSGTVSGDVTIDVQGASLGVYSLVVSTTKPLDATSALALAKATFPGVANFTYSSYTVTKGYAWMAKGTVNGIDPKTKKVTVMAEAVILYVLPSANGKLATITATVGRGDFATAIK